MPPRLEWACLGAILVLTALAHATALHASYQFDDWNVIVEAPAVQSLEAWWRSMPGIRPLLKLSYALNHVLLPGPVGFRSINLLLHLCNVVGVHCLLRRAFPDTPGLALWCAMVFALHPAQTEAVTYLSGRSVSLCATASLASLLAWQHAVAGRPLHRGAMALSVACLLLALSVKEYAVVVPLAAVLLDRCSHPERSWPQRLRRAAPLAFVVVAVLVAALAVPRFQDLIVSTWHHLDAQQTLLTQGHALRYLLEQFWRVDRLNADPGLPTLMSFSDDGAWDWIGMVALALISAFAWWKGHRLGWAGLWFFLWLLPTHTALARLDPANDRHVYLAMIGPAWWAGSTAYWIAAHVRAGRLVSVAGVSVIALSLALLTATRAEVYRDELTFWLDVTRKSPHNARAYTNLGYAYAQACQLDAARTAWQYALALNPTNDKARVNLILLNTNNLPLKDQGTRRDCSRDRGDAHP